MRAVRGNVLIRRADTDDAEAVEAARVTAWKVAYRAFMPHAFLDSLDPMAKTVALRTALNADPRPFSMNVAEVEGRVAGFSILGKPRYQSSKRAAELWALNVHPQYWRRGVGRCLVMQALSDTREQGYALIELWCIRGNAAASRLYESCGFKVDGRHRTTLSLTGHPLHEVAFMKGILASDSPGPAR